MTLFDFNVTESGCAPMRRTKMPHISRLPVLTWKEDDVYVADCPAVRIASQGETEEEALNNLKEAIELYFEDAPCTELPSCDDLHAREIEVALAS
jgi:predicted RNase H-like HicB family nuclease